MAQYDLAGEMENIGRSLISEHYPELLRLRIAFMFRKEALMRNGRIVPGTTTRVTDRDYQLHHNDFVVVIARDVWDQFSAEYRYALVDHFLGFCGIRTDQTGAPETDPTTDRVRTFKKTPDVIEFTPVVKRHGAYTAEIQEFLVGFAERRNAAKEEERRKKRGESPLADVLDPE